MLNDRKNVNVRLNGSNILLLEETRICEFLPENIASKTLAVKVNNEVHSIYYKVLEDCNIESITYYSEEGERIYSRSLKFIFLKAFRELFPDAKLEFTNKMGRDFFVKVTGIKLDEEKLSTIRAKIKTIIDAKIPINKFKVSFDEAKRIYKKMDSLEQLENFKIKTRESYTFYECDGYFNYLYGLLIPNTSYIKGWDITLYDDGIVILLPRKDNINIVDINLNQNKVYNEFRKFKKFAGYIGIKNVADINSHVLDGTISDVIRFSEADHNRRLVEIIQNIIGKPCIKVVFISGPSSSGKTTFSQKLAIELRIVGKNAIPLAMDNYFHDEENIPLDENGQKDYENIKNIDMELFKANIFDMLDGKVVNIPEYNFAKSRKEYSGRKISLHENDILIVEGIHALNPLITDIIEEHKVYKIYVAPLVTLGFDNYTKVSSNDTRLIRRIVRDFDSRSTIAETTLMLWPKVRKGEEENIFPYVDRADYIYNTNLIYELGVLKPFAENLLLRVPSSSKYYSDARRLYKLIINFRQIETSEIPADSIVKEFVGKGCFYR